MAIYSERNLYPGVNAHLNSVLQAESSRWRSYHSYHITDLARGIDQWLPPGYRTLAEQSLQGGEIQISYGRPTHLHITPDVTIYQDASARHRPKQTSLQATEPIAVLPATYLLEEDIEDTLSGVVIYQIGEAEGFGRPITRIELLSPANKPGGSHHRQYSEKRLQALKSGLRMVEIDYLHESPSIHRVLPSYRNGDADAYPYTILVTDPRPNLDKGNTFVYGAAIDKSLPIVEIPLAGADIVLVDFGSIYNRTFEATSYLQDLVDYAQDPVNFDRYTPADQAKIHALLDEIRHTNPKTSE